MRSRMGIFINIGAIFFVSLFFLEIFFIFASTNVCANMAVSPPDVTINMKNVFPEKEIKFNVGVENLNTYDTNVTAKVENQIPYELRSNYTDIPNLSWIKITPSTVHLSGKESKLLEVTITIPDEEKSLHYNERWEFVVVLSEIKHGNIKTEIAVPVYIKTPEKTEMQMPNTFILLSIVGGFILLSVFILYIKMKRRF